MLSGSTTMFKCLNTVYIDTCAFNPKESCLVHGMWNAYTELLVWLKRKNLRHTYITYIFIRLSGSLYFLLGIDGIVLSQLIHKKIWLLMHPYKLYFNLRIILNYI